MRLSVIIPVYKVEQTLDCCVESVLTQNVPDMEVILIDDGSPDKCPELCDNWALKDNRIRVIHKQNGGLSDARNAGLDIAQGEYVSFVDSDDYLEGNTFLPLMDYLQKFPSVDILEYPIKHGASPKLSLTDTLFDNAKDYWLTTKAWCHSFSCNKIYKRELFDKCRFVKGRIFEDLYILPDLLNNSSKIATLPIGTYIYTINEEGISRQVNKHTIFQLLRSEIRAAFKMRTMPWDKNGWNIYYYMLCRCYDILRLSIGIKIK